MIFAEIDAVDSDAIAELAAELLRPSGCRRRGRADEDRFRRAVERRMLRSSPAPRMKIAFFGARARSARTRAGARTRGTRVSRNRAGDEPDVGGSTRRSTTSPAAAPANAGRPRAGLVASSHHGWDPQRSASSHASVECACSSRRTSRRRRADDALSPNRQRSISLAPRSSSCTTSEAGRAVRTAARGPRDRRAPAIHSVRLPRPRRAPGGDLRRRSQLLTIRHDTTGASPSPRACCSRSRSSRRAPVSRSASTLCCDVGSAGARRRSRRWLHGRASFVGALRPTRRQRADHARRAPAGRGECSYYALHAGPRRCFATAELSSSLDATGARAGAAGGGRRLSSARRGHEQLGAIIAARLSSPSTM